MNILLLGLLAFVLIAAATAQDGFTDYGVGAKVAECRGVVTTRTPDGRHLAIANALDVGPRQAGGISGCANGRRSHSRIRTPYGRRYH